MLKVENIQVFGIESAIRGMRNPVNSWDRSDSIFIEGQGVVGDADLSLMCGLTEAGTEHRKFLRMIHVQMDVVAPLYWWKEFDTYKVGTVSNSCSTMHTIHKKKFELADFSTEHMSIEEIDTMNYIIRRLNVNRDGFNKLKDKCFWWNIIQLLPTSFNQRRTVDLNYEVAMNIIRQRSIHKLDEWKVFVDVLKDLPYMNKLSQ